MRFKWLAVMDFGPGLSRSPEARKRSERRILTEECRKKYGPAFRILAMGQTRIFVTTPALINFVYKNTEALCVLLNLVADHLLIGNSSNFPYWRKVIQVSGFGMQLATSFSPVFDDRLFAEHHRVMQSSAIVGVTQRYLNLLQGGIRGRLDQIPPGESEEVNLTDLVLDIMVSLPGKRQLVLRRTVHRILESLVLPVLPISLDEERLLRLRQSLPPTQSRRVALPTPLTSCIRPR